MTAPQVSGEIFNIGYGKGITLIDSVIAIRNFLPELTFEMIPWPENFKKIETGDYISNISKIEKIIGWKPTTSFPEGISKTISFYKEYLHVS
jgi:UDP-glucose 4-epimerase